MATRKKENPAAIPIVPELRSLEMHLALQLAGERVHPTTGSLQALSLFPGFNSPWEGAFL